MNKKQQIQQVIDKLYSQLETTILTLTQNVQQITIEIANQEIESITKLNQSIDTLRLEIEELSSACLYGLPIPNQPSIQLQSTINDEEIDDYIRNSLEELKLMKVITQQINESYIKMQNIIQKRYQCEKYLQSFIDSTERLKRILFQ